jgi:hypothetical protein
MRRPLAFLLTLFFAVGPLHGLLEANDDLRLPACCRRHGAHHCEMSEDVQAALELAISSTPVLKAPATCPSFPGFALGFSIPSHALMARVSLAPALVELGNTLLGSSAGVPTTNIRTRSGRAPPSLL